MTAASGTTTVHGTVRGSTGTATTMTTIGARRGGFAAAPRASVRATETVATTTGRDSDRRSVVDHRHLPRGAIAKTGMTTGTAGAAHRSAEGRAVSRTVTAALTATDGDLKPRSAADLRRLRRATAVDRLVEARRRSRSVVVRIGGPASAAMEGAAHSPGVVGLVSADSVVAASAAGPTTSRASALDHSRTAVDLQPLTGDRGAADAGGVKSMTTDVVGAGVTTAIDAPSNCVSYLDR